MSTKLEVLENFLSDEDLKELQSISLNKTNDGGVGLLFRFK